MNRLSTMRTGIKGAINACPGLEAITVQDAASLDAIWGNAIRRHDGAIVLIYVGTRKVKEGPISGFTNDPCSFVWQTALIAENWQTSTGALSKDGGIWDMADALLGPPGGEQGVRPVAIMKIGPDTVYLRFVSEQMMTPPDRPDRAGPAALVITWETFPEVQL